MLLPLRLLVLIYDIYFLFKVKESFLILKPLFAYTNSNNYTHYTKIKPHCLIYLIFFLFKFF